MKTIPSGPAIVLLAVAFFINQHACGQAVPLGQENLVRHLDQELSGETAKRNLEYISGLHRMRGSDGYNQAIAFIQDKLQAYGLEGIEVIDIPTDGKTMYGTQKSRPAWNADFAELWEMERRDSGWVNVVKLADYQAIPLVLAQDSHSGEVMAELVDIGAGTSETDYAGKTIQGKLVMTSSQPEAVVPLAVEKYGASGIISYAQNQVTAWWKENENLIRWGHLDTFSKTKTFAFMVSLKQARNLTERLAKSEIIRLHAKVSARQTPGTYKILTARIRGNDPDLGHEEVAFSCHLDHPRPGANDNASGCMAILETARTLGKLIAEGKIARPARSLRFIWSPEIEGTIALLNFRPEMAANIKFNIHMDMVGGGPETKATFHVSGSPQSLPSFINDVGEAFGAFVNLASEAYAGGREVPFPLVSEEGGREPLHAVLGDFSMGSDFEVYSEGSFRIPSIYLHDWPDRYIHTNYDVAANIDPTKLKRAAFIGAGSGFYLAGLGNEHLPELLALMKKGVLQRASSLLEKNRMYPRAEQENALHYFWLREMEALQSLKPYAGISPEVESDFTAYLSNLRSAIGRGKAMEFKNREARIIYARNEHPKGPMAVFGYNYFDDHYKPGLKMPALLSYTGIHGSGGEYTYEALNLVNGNHTVMEIRNRLSAEFGPVPVELVSEYLEALKETGVIEQF